MKVDINTVNFKRATILDIHTLIEFRVIFLTELQGKPAKKIELSLRASLKHYFEKALKDDSFISWIAEIENKPIGFSGMVIREQPGNFEIPNGKTGYILNMFTLGEYRSNGIGKLLLQKLIIEAKQKNLSRIDLHATDDGEQIYRSFGFTEPHHKVLELALFCSK